MDTYSMKIVCGNCDFEGEETIPKGTSVGAHKCPNCGVIGKIEKASNPEDLIVSG